MGKSPIQQPVLFVCNHPGGVQAILPVICDLKKRNIPLYGVVSKRASSAFKGIAEVFVLKEMAQKKFCYEILYQVHPQVLVLGTSEPVDPVIGRMEAVFTNCARKKRIPTISILDHWCGYRDRYSETDEMLLDALPDSICVMDQKAFREMVSVGFPREILQITGNPGWDQLKERRNLLVKSAITRELAGIPEDKKIWLFISEPIKDDGQDTKYGFSEYEVLDNLLDYLGKNEDKNIFLLITTHPRETPRKYSEYFDNIENISVGFVSKDMDILQCGFDADKVIGITSMLLIKLSLLGIPVISFQPSIGKKPLLELEYGVHNLKDISGIDSIDITQNGGGQNFYDFNGTHNVLKELGYLIKAPETELINV